MKPFPPIYSNSVGRKPLSLRVSFGFELYTIHDMAAREVIADKVIRKQIFLSLRCVAFSKPVFLPQEV